MGSGSSSVAAASGAAAGGSSSLFGAAAGGARTVNLTINVQATGGLSAGFQMLAPTDRRRFATDIATELGLKANLQTNLGAGYAASR